MMITPMPNAAATVQGSVETGGQPGKVEMMRSLKMKTNFNPTQVNQAPPPTPAADQLSISAPNEGTKATVEATQPLSPQFAELARQRRSLQVMKRELENQRKAMEAQQSQGRDSIPLARLKSEPLSVLLESGVTYDQLAEAIVSNQGNPEVSALKAELKALKEGVDQKFVDKDNQARQQVVSEMKNEAQRLVSQGEQFALIREERLVPQVIRLIEETFDKDGELLDVHEACKLVEEHRFNQIKKLAALEKVRGGMSPEPTAPQHMQQQHQGIRTLTNRHTANVAQSKRDRAIAAFFGNLKQ